MAIGALLGFGGYLLYKFIKEESPNLIEALLSLTGGAIVGLLPDLLEPARNPNHRSLFHSSVILALIAYGNYRVWQNGNLSENQKLALSLLSSAYGSHLIADSTTTKGLPLLF
ncbi:MAG: hypothetical protein A2W22_02360 [Candidatus Levybacteria bacterium RBG_16_35_11]|nr:MAG: hypothetical protein A2W22_02360 [Candidatus Levybacteria bacterium RBG_16_35_11]